MKRLVFSLAILIFVVTACSEEHDPRLLFDHGEYDRAYALWKPLAEQGDTVAQNYIGIQYYLGLGKKRDFKIAKEWFERSAIAGYADAQYNLGVMYQNGEFVEKDYVTAYMWFHLANENGNTHATRRMQTMADEHKLFPNQMNLAIERAKEYSN